MNNDITVLGVLQIVSYVIGFIGIAGGVFSFLRYNNYKVTVAMQNDSIKALQENNKIVNDALEKAHAEIKALQLESAERIGVLTGQVQLYKDLNLGEIAKSLVIISKTEATILETLKKSAVSLAKEKHDGGLLVKTEDVSPLDVKQVGEK